MKTKELLEARWKLISFALLALLVAGLNVGSYQFVKGLMPEVSTGGSIPPSIQNLLQERLASFNAFAWGDWFQLNASFILGLGAAILCCGLIAGEVSKGTIFFLLSKPVSRERI